MLTIREVIKTFYNALLQRFKKYRGNWEQNDPNADDYIKNRPFYTGDPVETVLVEESTIAFEKSYGSIYYVQFLSPFYVTAGETYKVFWDGTTYECSCVDFEDNLVIGNLSILGEGADTGEPFIMSVINGERADIGTTDTSASHTFSISGIAQKIIKIDEKYIPDTIATKSDVESAQTAADNNKELIYNAFSQTATFIFDKQTSGRDTFVFNALHYYKISDFNPAPEDVISFTGTRESGEKLSRITIGNNCVKYGLFIVVASAGTCSIKFDDGTIMSFTAPSAGLYAVYTEGNVFMTAGTGEFTLVGIDGLNIRSSTYGSTKKFRITVDDSGKPTFTNSSDSADSYTPTDLPTVTASDSGKFLRVSSAGEWVAETIPNASGVSF